MLSSSTQIPVNGPSTGQRILVIEDELLIAWELTATLVAAGITDVHTVTTEAQAIEQIAKERWDGVITDGCLHGITIERIVELLLKRSIPFIVVTGLTRDRLPATIADAPVIEKPFRSQLLVETLVRTLLVGSERVRRVDIHDQISDACGPVRQRAF